MLIVDVPMKVAFVSSSRIGAKTIYTIMPITLNKLFIGDRFFLHIFYPSFFSI